MLVRGTGRARGAVALVSIRQAFICNVGTIVVTLGNVLQVATLLAWVLYIEKRMLSIGSRKSVYRASYVGLNPRPRHPSSFSLLTVQAHSSAYC